MRLWHKDMILILPRQQLLGQWRECCLIAKNIAEKGTPNHILVNKIMDYPLEHFVAYTLLVRKEMLRRGYSCDWSKFSKWLVGKSPCFGVKLEIENVFKNWHNTHYWVQCYYNLEEKYECGGIPESEWRFNK